RAAGSVEVAEQRGPAMIRCASNAKDTLLAGIIRQSSVRRLAVGAVGFLQQWEPHGPWVLTGIDPDANRVETVTLKSCEEFVAVRWIAGRMGRSNIYFSVNRPRYLLNKKAQKTDIKDMLALHVDVDPVAGKDLAQEQSRIEATLREYSPEPSVI